MGTAERVRAARTPFSGVAMKNTLVLLDELESSPYEYPAAPEGLSAAAAAIPADVVWDRIERYTRTRWIARPVVWQVECGRKEAFCPRLSPAAFVMAHRWDEDSREWTIVDIDAAPWGVLIDSGSWQLTFKVGGGPPPLRALEAYRRLAEYWAEAQASPGLANVRDGDYSATFDRNALARALQLSGAADLLRPYR